MTMMMYAAPFMGMPKMDIAGMLGTMVVTRRAAATTPGMVMHFMAGVIFALIYALLWSLGLGSATWWWGLIFGAVHGAGAVVMMPIMMRINPRRPEMPAGPLMTMGLMMGHLIYGLIVALVYAVF